MVTVKTDFGWTLKGLIQQVACAVSFIIVAVWHTGVVEQLSSLSNKLLSFGWELESLRISGNNCVHRKKKQKLKEDFLSVKGRC